ncbi:MAG: Wzz/FepE/Etk N-terminal domain-containing protein, partial [Planctomycetota bacterium]
MNVSLGDIVSTVRNRWLCLFATTFLFTAASLGYALLKQDKFDARLPLIVRDEGYGSLSRLGDFTSVDAMQTAQETILEVAKHPSVLRAALLDVGPGKGEVRKGGEEWPSPKFVNEFADDVSVSAPGG